MSPCCGRPDNRANKKGAKDYYERYAYLSSHQRAQQAELVGSKCPTCDALTMSDQENKCTICGVPKAPQSNNDA
jgi:uncharacterized paraquat-inducible protein A